MAPGPTRPLGGGAEPSIRGGIWVVTPLERRLDPYGQLRSLRSSPNLSGPSRAVRCRLSPAEKLYHYSHKLTKQIASYLANTHTHTHTEHVHRERPYCCLKQDDREDVDLITELPEICEVWRRFGGPGEAWRPLRRRTASEAHRTHPRLQTHLYGNKGRASNC